MTAKILILLLALIFSVSTVFAAIPLWYTEGANEEFPLAKYIRGVGSGDTDEKAVYKAQMEIAGQIETQIQGGIATMVSAYVSSDQEYIEAEYHSVGMSLIQADLIGAQVAKKAMEAGVHYVMIVLERKSYGESLLHSLEQKKNMLNKMHEDTENLLANGQIIQAIEGLLATDDLACEFIAQSVIYTSISGNNYDTSGLVYGPGLFSKIRKILASVRLEKISGDDQLAARGKLLPEPLTIRVLTRNDAEEKANIANVRLELRDNQGKRLDRQYSDNQGIAEFYPYASNDESGKFVISLDIQRLPEILAHDLQDLHATFNYKTSETTPLSFTIEVRDKDGNRLSKVEKTIAKSVTSAGHHAGEDAPFLLTGNMSVQDVAEVEALGGTQYVAKSELVLFLRSKVTGEDMGNISIIGKGLDQNSQEKAIEKSFDKIKVSSQDLGELLAEAADKLQLIREKLSKDALDRGKALYINEKYKEALTELAQVTDGEAYVKESRQLSDQIKEHFSLEADWRREQELNKELQSQLEGAKTTLSRTEAELAQSKAQLTEKDLVLRLVGKYVDPITGASLTLNQDRSYSFSNGEKGTWEILSPDKLQFEDLVGKHRLVYWIAEAERLLVDKATYFRE